MLRFVGAGDKGRRISAKLSDSGAALNSLLAGSLAESFPGSRVTGRFQRFRGLARIAFDDPVFESAIGLWDLVG